LVLLLNLLFDLNVVVICEHWLCELNISFLQHIDNTFIMIGKTENVTGSKRGSGGIALLVRKLKFCKIRTVYVDSNMATVHLSNDNCIDLFVIGVRFPFSNKTNEVYKKCVDDLFAQYEQCYAQGTVFICGDLNADINKI